MKKNEMKRTIAIGDIHGCYFTLIDLLNGINYNPENDMLITLGDYIDRGYYPDMVLGYLIDMKLKYPKNIICIKGNHEQMFIDAHRKSNIYKNYKYYDGQTYECLKYNLDKYLEFMNSLPYFYELNDYIFVHGGVVNPIISENTKDSFIWTYANTYVNKTNKFVVCGHSAMNNACERDDGVICIDTGCCYKNKLTVLIISGDNRKYYSVNTNSIDK